MPEPMPGGGGGGGGSANGCDAVSAEPSPKTMACEWQ